MGGLLALSRGIDRMTTAIGRSVAWLILLAILVSAINAIVRKVFSISSNAWLELQWYLFGAAFMLASAYTLLQNEHIRIDVVYGRWSRRAQHWIDLAGTVLFLLPFTALMIWVVTPKLIENIAENEVSMNAGGLLIWPARAILLAGFVLLFIQGLSEIVKKIAVMRGRIPDPHHRTSPHESVLHEAELMTGGHGHLPEDRK
ncbi:TRAP transporter small permease subunit [Paracoccus sp. 1_MG-2023]|uniref:TRAP transporter small permease subunit n=1 Tax=unclassified Paracoccus (in: a-proteobacteria) TaxID=2688777 RepID=UPI001C0912EC|nr:MULTISPECIES: TRAP transporter small permease subunit [unclassified Paracoccus (in: a-proteobacteria)]MBU2958817.1 TRAP transporter small permease subunit [Paracoccus sp. C2R09]MDO6670052.1 TRAP transporter small permease subunit [Paracoccus sp. 1_MG-2023]